MAQSVTLFIKAKSLVAGELKRAGAAIKGFATGAAHIVAGATKAFLAFGAALVGIGIKAISSYAESEKAVNALASAHRMYGEDVETLVAAETKLAAEMQNETGVGDNLTISRMASLKMLGIQTEQLGSAAKATIALVKAGMGEDKAMRMVADAANGNFEAFSKVIPALKNITDESEKARMVNEYLAQQYERQKDQLNTVGGQWGALKERVGDAWEEVGKAIAQNDALAGVLKKAGDKVKELSARFAEWAQSGGVVNLIATVKMFWENFRHTFSQIGIYAKGFFMGGIWNPGKKTFQYIGSIIGAFVNLTVTRFEYMRDMAISVFNKIKHPLKDFEPPNTNMVKAAYAEMGKAIKGEYVDKGENAFVTMMKEEEAEAVKHAKNMVKITEKQMADLKAARTAKADFVGPPEPLKPSDIANEEKALQDKIDKLKKELAEKKKEYTDEKGNQDDKAAIDALQAKIDKTQALIDKNKELAGMSVQGIIDQGQADKDAKDAEDKDRKKAEKLWKKAMDNNKPMGGKMSKENEEWLKAWLAQQKAKQDAIDAENQNKIDKAKLMEMQNKDSENLGKIWDEAKEIRKNLDNAAKLLDLLQAGK